MDRSEITTALVERLVAEQFPEWAHLGVNRLASNGWDNTTMRLGSEMSVRLPNGDGYTAQVDREQRWLPILGPQLPLPIPVPLAKGEPSPTFPRPWSVYRWLPGEPASDLDLGDPDRLAIDLADFLRTLYALDVTDGPLAGPRSHGRGAPLGQLDDWARQSIAACSDEVDPLMATTLWERALAAEFEGPPSWLHGDVAPANLLVEDGRLSAVIDFGCSVVGDPACDLMIAYTFFDGAVREVFRRALGVDDATWLRGQGWTLWKAMLVLQDEIEDGGAQPKWHEMGWARTARQVIEELLADQR